MRGGRNSLFSGRVYESNPKLFGQESEIMWLNLPEDISSMMSHIRDEHCSRGNLCPFK